MQMTSAMNCLLGKDQDSEVLGGKHFQLQRWTISGEGFMYDSTIRGGKATMSFEKRASAIALQRYACCRC